MLSSPSAPVRQHRQTVPSEPRRFDAAARSRVRREADDTAGGHESCRAGPREVADVGSLLAGTLRPLPPLQHQSSLATPRLLLHSCCKARAQRPESVGMQAPDLAGDGVDLGMSRGARGVAMLTAEYAASQPQAGRRYRRSNAPCWPPPQAAATLCAACLSTSKWPGVASARFVGCPSVQHLTAAALEQLGQIDTDRPEAGCA